ncbi:hypothetical protein ACLB1S_05930 [Escherichia coli]
MLMPGEMLTKRAARYSIFY